MKDLPLISALINPKSTNYVPQSETRYKQDQLEIKTCKIRNVITTVLYVCVFLFFIFRCLSGGGVMSRCRAEEWLPNQNFNTSKRNPVRTVLGV